MSETEKREWGVVQALKVEADTRTSLIAAITIAMAEHRTVKRWAVREGELVLLWSDDEDDEHPLLTPLEDPDDVATLAENWLSSSEYPAEPDTDGSIKKGFKVSTAYGYTVCKIAPCWIVYGK